MEDEKIIDLYWARCEDAVKETSQKYGKYCYGISYNILHSREDAQECVNDTYVKAWESIPPHRPNSLSAFLGKITRNLSLNLYEKNRADKRGSGQVPFVLEELSECIPSGNTVESAVDSNQLTELLNKFLSETKTENRTVFVLRYWYMYSVKEIAERQGSTQSRIKMILLRTRKSLKSFLEKEDMAY